MIIKKFEEQVERFSKKLAVKAGNQSLTYAELNCCANGVAHEILRGDKAVAGNINSSIVSLLFEHGVDMIVGIIGALKANKTYVPLDVTYPRNRLLDILEHSESYVILTNHKNLPLAETLTKQPDKKIRILTIDNVLPTPGEIPGNHIKREAAGDRPAYILYTSGSTGRPKGVVQSHQNVLYFIDHWTRGFSITGSQRMTLLASLTHDGAVPDIFAALLNGAALYPYDIKERPGITELIGWLRKEKITIWHSVPTFYRYFIRALSGDEIFPDLQLIVLGGEEVRTHDVKMFKTYFPSAKFANIYGQSESTVNSIWLYSPGEPFKKVIIGEPIGKTEILLVDESGGTVEEVGTGEIVIASDHVALEYWKDKENSEIVFTNDSELGRLYWTGDWGRLTADGDIVFIGRKDLQVKIRGFRVETTEIETRLLNHHALKEAVVVAKEDENADNYLCAYIVPDEPLAPAELREFLSAELPGYMIPQYFINIEKMPLTASGKIDRKALPEPGRDTFQPVEYEAPSNEIEKEITRMWQETLGKEKIGIHANFFDLGGHSLLIITLISKIHQTLHVKLELKDVFDHPTIEELSRLIMKSKKTTFSSIEPVEKREYYAMSSAQKRLFVLEQSEPDGIVYNLPLVMELEGELDKGHMVETFRRLIRRHESLRTSFMIVGNEPVQQIHDEVEFEIEYDEAPGLQPAAALISSFIRPFDLSQAPLLRLGLINVEVKKYILMVDMHHIVSDGRSHQVLTIEFNTLYEGESLPLLKLQYKDFARWHNRQLRSGKMKEQEAYWLKEFENPVPGLKLPFDFPRPAVQRFEGSVVEFELSTEQSNQLRELAGTEKVTMFTLVFTLYNVFLSRLSGQEDIVVGAVIAGRRHADLESVIGMFVNTLALRNYPSDQVTFGEFLKAVTQRTVEAFENQDYQFEDVVEKVLTTRDASRNPLFDVMFTYAPLESMPPPGFQAGKRELNIRPYEPESTEQEVKFDMILAALDGGGPIAFSMAYCTKLFKKKPIQRFTNYFKEVAAAVLQNKEIQLKDIKISHELQSAKTDAYRVMENDLEF